MRKFSLLILTVFLFKAHLAQNAANQPVAKAVRTNERIIIDGKVEEVWQKAEVITGFRQFKPMYNSSPGQNTEVRVLYDNHHIYVAAIMYDCAPDSILKQLGNRDDELNADYISIEFDTYNNRMDAYEFKVFASGVQADSRHADASYNAVWNSAVCITTEGWIAELAIPYSALRFPGKPVQLWGMQITRKIRRYREFDQWSLENQGTDNKKYQWGTLEGIYDISPPLRLSLSPYFSMAAGHYPFNLEGRENFSYAYSGGADLKYGINESYTLDITLMPDFSQVQSDNRIKNLSAFETTYGEFRPFFSEAIDLFNRGGLFYSRRIGKIPQRYNMVYNNLQPGEKLVENPWQAPLLNAVKLSGRSSSGLAVGFFNAVTNNTWAVLQDSSGNTRRILTEPLSNYNILVLDQTLKNNSRIYLINTSVNREGGYSDANVSGFGGQLMDRRQLYKIQGSIVNNRIWYGSEDPGYKDISGFKYDVGAGKAAGNFQFWGYRRMLDRDYDINHIGISHRNDEIQQEFKLSYYVYDILWKFRNIHNSLSLFNRRKHSSGESMVYEMLYSGGFTDLNYLSVWYSVKAGLTEELDFYEPRRPGLFYIWPKYTFGSLGFSSDYRKPFALDGSVSGWVNTENANESSVWIRPVFRLGDRMSLNLRWQHYTGRRHRGFVAATSDSTYFGRRNIMVDENTVNMKYMFMNNLSLSLRLRHYWSRGTYDRHYLLGQDGRLQLLTTNAGQHNYDFNSFNVDMVFNWEFAPGSNLTLVWKNDLLQEQSFITQSYLQKIYHTFESPQYNTISLKVLYYIDYSSVNKNRKTSRK